jgi:hypothetical protein
MAKTLSSHYSRKISLSFGMPAQLPCEKHVVFFGGKLLAIPFPKANDPAS